MNELIKSLVGKTLNLSEEQVASYLYEEDGTTVKADAVDKFIEIDAARIKALKEAHKADLTAMHDRAYSEAKGETLSKYEERLKEELGLQTEAKGIDLVKEAIAKFAKTEIDEEKVKLHPRYIELEKKLNQDFISKAEYDKIKGEFDLFKNEIEKTKVSSVIKQDAIRLFRSLKPVLSKDPIKATNQEDDFVNKLIAFEYDLQNDGNHIIKQGGRRLETVNGYPVTFADFVKSEAAKYYDFQQQDERGNSGNNNGSNSGGGITMPQTQDEYIQMLANESDPVKSVALMNAWKAKNAK